MMGLETWLVLGLMFLLCLLAVGVGRIFLSVGVVGQGLVFWLPISVSAVVSCLSAASAKGTSASVGVSESGGLVGESMTVILLRLQPSKKR